MAFIKRILFCVLIFTAWVGAAFEYAPSDPRNIGQGMVIINFSQGFSGSMQDPASLADITRIGLSFNGGVLFRMKNLGHEAGNLVLPLNLGTLGVGFSSFGNQLYAESQIILGWGQRVHHRVMVGVGINYYSLSVRDYGSASSFGLTLAWHIQLGPQLFWGGILKNINSPTIGYEKEALPQIIVSGLYVPFSEFISAQIEWEQDTLYDGWLKFGVRLYPLPWLTLATGYASGRMTAGVGLQLKYVFFDYSFVTHPHLGFSQWVGVSIPLLRP